MKKEYNLPEEEDNFQENSVNEPMVAYGMETEMKILPALTEEELAECMTGDEFLEAVLAHIDSLFDNRS